MSQDYNNGYSGTGYSSPTSTDFRQGQLDRAAQDKARAPSNYVSGEGSNISFWGTLFSFIFVLLVIGCIVYS